MQAFILQTHSDSQRFTHIGKTGGGGGGFLETTTAKATRTTSRSKSFKKLNNFLHVLIARFLVHFFAVPARPRCVILLTVKTLRLTVTSTFGDIGGGGGGGGGGGWG